MEARLYPVSSETNCTFSPSIKQRRRISSFVSSDGWRGWSGELLTLLRSAFFLGAAFLSLNHKYKPWRLSGYPNIWMTFVMEWHLSYNAKAFSRCSFEYISCSFRSPKVQLFVRTHYRQKSLLLTNNCENNNPILENLYQLNSFQFHFLYPIDTIPQEYSTEEKCTHNLPPTLISTFYLFYRKMISSPNWAPNCASEMDVYAPEPHRLRISSHNVALPLLPASE